VEELLFSSGPSISLLTICGLQPPSRDRPLPAVALAGLRQPGDGPAWLRSPLEWAGALLLLGDHVGLARIPNCTDNLWCDVLEQQTGLR
jgi:hypothetical protein